MSTESDQHAHLARCSFCAKTQDQVLTLIAGPNHVFICDECVALCTEIVAEIRANQPTSSLAPPSEQA